MDELELSLASRFDAPVGLTFGRASAGLYALFRALRADAPGGEVLIPELCCETVPLAAYYAGLRPVMVDVDPDTLGPSVDDVAAKLGPKTCAIVVVYLFGVPFEIEPFLAMKRDHDLVVIEDVAQAIGGEFRGDRLGGRGDATVISFDDRKILRGKGGALVLRERGALADQVASIRDEIDVRPMPAEFDTLKASFTDLTRALRDLSRCQPDADIASQYRLLLPHYEPVVVTPQADIPRAPIISQLDLIEAEQARRFERYRSYRRGLAGTRWRVIDYPEGAMCWRVPVVAPDSATALAAAARIRANDLPASNHYFPLGQLLDGTSAPIAGDLGRRLLNLWVDDVVDDSDVDRILDLILGS